MLKYVGGKSAEFLCVCSAEKESHGEHLLVLCRLPAMATRMAKKNTRC